MSLVCRNPCRDIPRLLWPSHKQEPIHKLIVDRQALEEREARVLSMALSSRGSALKVLYLYKNQISMQSLCTILLGLSSSLAAPRQLPSCMVLSATMTHPHNTAGCLESLYLCVTRLPFPVVQLLSSVLRSNDMLKELYLWENQLDEASVVHLSVHGIASNRTLTKLVITRNTNMTGRAAAAVIEAFGRSNADEITIKQDQKIQQQRVLNLSNNKLDADQMDDLIVPISRANLAKLCFDGNPLGDDGARALAEALSYNPMILRLDVARTRLGSGGVMALARQGLVENNHLRHLVLSHNNGINRRCLQVTLEVLRRSNKTMHYMDLPRSATSSTTNATTDAIMRCQIEFYLTLNRAGRQQVCHDTNLDWSLFPWILAGNEASIIYYFLSIKPELCRRRSYEI